MYGRVLTGLNRLCHVVSPSMQMSELGNRWSEGLRRKTVSFRVDYPKYRKIKWAMLVAWVVAFRSGFYEREGVSRAYLLNGWQMPPRGNEGVSEGGSADSVVAATEAGAR